DRHVIAHVDHLLAVRLRPPILERLGKGRALRLDDEVDVARRSPEGGRDLAGFDVVDRRRPAEGHVEMGVWVDAARKNVFAARVDHLVGLDVERLADQRNPLALDVNVSDIVVRGRDHAAALDQNGHRSIPSLTRVAAEVSLRRPPLASNSGYSPPGVTSTVGACQLAPLTSAPSAFSASTAAF